MKSYSYECSLKTMKDPVSYEVHQAFVIVIVCQSGILVYMYIRVHIII